MAGPLSKYSFINAKLRARISMILPEEVFEELAKAPSLEAALALLRDTPFARLEEIYSVTGDMKQAELELLKSEIELYRNIRQYLHENSIDLVDALLGQFEIDNLKNAIRIYFDRKIRKRSGDTGIHYTSESFTTYPSTLSLMPKVLTRSRAHAKALHTARLSGNTATPSNRKALSSAWKLPSTISIIKTFWHQLTSWIAEIML